MGKEGQVVAAMKYYSQEETKELRSWLEEKVLRWPQVNRRKMFGCPCYQVNGKLFAFLVTSGIVITQLDRTDREALSDQHEITAFQAGKKVVQSWARLSIKNKEQFNQIVPFVRKSYESALRKP